MDHITNEVIEALAEGVPFYNALSGHCSEDVIQELAQKLRYCMELIEAEGGAVIFE